ncbi:MAG: PDZ domain-containing protein [Chloroflexota bacterium]|nr:PDZ domain-containing protein [Chloroflexota bacterium]
MTTIQYAVSMPRPETHLFHVEVQVNDPEQAEFDFVMPSWTPGSYLIREFSRHVQEFEAFCPECGESLDWQKVNKNTWRVTNPGKLGAVIRYLVYANELSVRTSHLDTSHGYFNGATLFMYLDGYRHQPVALSVTPPFADWIVSTGLPEAAATSGGGNGAGNGSRHISSPAIAGDHYCADDYDHLIDCPVEIGNHRLLSFEVDGKPHQIAIWGHGNEDMEQLQVDTEAIVRTARDIFGELPYDRYLFILHLTERRRGGLEHRNSSTNAVSRWSFAKPEEYERTLALLAHEFFHAWNVKRIEPASFSNFEYRWETYTRLLWVMEGFTTYYEVVLLRRAGLVPPERMLNVYGERNLRLLQTPGRHFQSAEAASFDTWIKFYRPDENTQNTSVSYYLKGSLIALMLDLQIRDRTGNRRSLDDVMVAMYRDFTLRGAGIPDEQFQAVCEKVAGGSLETFFEDHVRGVAELPFEQCLEKAGLELSYGWKGDEFGDRAAGLGIRLRKDRERSIVQTVFADGPAYHSDISAGDELIALDGYRVGKDTIGDRLAERSPGERVTLTLFRRDELRQVEITLGQRPYNKADIHPIDDASPEQKALYEAWLDAPWPLGEEDELVLSK